MKERKRLLLFYLHYTGKTTLAGTPSYELEDFVGAKFYHSI